MDNDPLWAEDNGSYWLLFPNKHALEIPKIKEIFAQYGKVMNITTAGDERGYRFVQFLTHVEAENAVKGLQNHPLIKLVKYRPRKKNNQNANKNISQRKCVIDDEVLTSNCKTKIITDNDNVSLSSISEGKSTRSSLKNYLSKKESILSNLPSNYKQITSPVQSVTSNKSKLFMKLQNLNINTGACNNLNNNQATNSILNDFKNEIPDLVVKNKVSLYKGQNRMILNAEEVIVGNIHENYGCAYILHIFEQYEPLAITYIKNILSSGIRYCHVYFKTQQDSLEVERRFDKHLIEGKKLVVLRPCKLLVEGIEL